MKIITERKLLYEYVQSRWGLHIPSMLYTEHDYLSPTLTLSHLSAHLVNRLLHANRKTIQIFLSGKNLFKNVTLQILNSIPVS